MVVSELKPMEEILASLAREEKIFLLGCSGCAEACQTGSEPQVLEMKKRLEEVGKVITGWIVIDFLCDKALVKMRLISRVSEVMAADSLLVMTCGVGVQAVATSVDKVVHPATNTLSVGGARGEWWSDERCRECGDCVLDFSGGICPLTKCTKGLLNGPCGGFKNGKCEVDPDIDCGWILIYERLKKLNQLEKLKAMVKPKSYGKMMLPPKALRSTIFWALELEKKEPEKKLESVGEVKK